MAISLGIYPIFRQTQIYEIHSYFQNMSKHIKTYTCSSAVPSGNFPYVHASPTNVILVVHCKTSPKLPCSISKTTIIHGKTTMFHGKTSIVHGKSFFSKHFTMFPAFSQYSHHELFIAESPFSMVKSPFFMVKTQFSMVKTPFSHGNITIFHGKNTIFHGQITIFHGNITIFHGQINIFHGHITIFHGKNTIFPW